MYGQSVHAGGVQGLGDALRAQVTELNDLLGRGTSGVNVKRLESNSDLSWLSYVEHSHGDVLLNLIGKVVVQS